MRIFVVTLFLFSLLLSESYSIETVWSVKSPAAIKKVKYSDDGLSIYTVCSDKKIRVYDAASGTITKELTVKLDDYDELDVSNDGKFAVGIKIANHPIVFYWDMVKDTFYIIKTFDHGNVKNGISGSFGFIYLTDLVISGDNELVYFLLNDIQHDGPNEIYSGSLEIMDINSFNILKNYPDYCYFNLTESHDYNFFVANYKSYSSTKSSSGYAFGEHFGCLLNHNIDTNLSEKYLFDNYNFSLDSKYLYTIKDSIFKIYQLDSLMEVSTFRISGYDRISSIIPTNDSDFVLISKIISGDTRNKIELLNMKSNTIVDSISFSGTKYFKLLPSPNSSNFLTASIDYNQVWYTIKSDSTITLYGSNWLNNDSLKVGFSNDISKGTKPLTVHFFDNSSKNDVQRLWEFGDGYTSTEEYPFHIYHDVGTYTVKLTIKDSKDSITVEKTNLITVYDWIKDANNSLDTIFTAKINETSFKPMMFTPDSKTLSVVSNYNTLHLIDVEKKKIAGEYNIPSSGHFAYMDFAPDGKKLIASAGLEYVCYLNPFYNQEDEWYNRPFIDYFFAPCNTIDTLNGYVYYVNDTTFIIGGSFYCYNPNPNNYVNLKLATALMYDKNSSKYNYLHLWGYNYFYQGCLNENKNKFASYALNDNSKFLTITNLANTNEFIERNVDSLSPMNSLCFSNDSKYISYIHNYKNLNILSSDSLNELNKVFTYSDTVLNYCFSTDDKFIISCLPKGIINILDIEKKTIVETTQVLEEIANLAVAPNGSMFATICTDGKLYFWKSDFITDVSENNYNNNNSRNSLIAYPNPFTGITTINYSVSENANHSNVNISIYNLQGELVATLLNERMKSGKYSIEFNGKGLMTGIYYCRILTLDESKTIILSYINE
jgi:PKD repeat protein